VYFKDNILGAIALQSFAEMIKLKYEKERVEFKLSEERMQFKSRDLFEVMTGSRLQKYSGCGQASHREEGIARKSLPLFCFSKTSVISYGRQCLFQVKTFAKDGGRRGNLRPAVLAGRFLFPSAGPWRGLPMLPAISIEYTANKQ